MTFNHGVEGSSPSALTNEIKYLAAKSTPKSAARLDRVHNLSTRWVLDDTDTIGLIAPLH